MGFTTTTTATLVASRTFLDEKGQIAYGFSRPTFYEKAQHQIDQARKEGADYVVVLSHLGDSDRGEHPSSVSLIARTTGIDAVLDGHDHHVLSDSIVHNLAGKPVLLASTGLKFQNIGLLTLSTDGKFSSRLVPSAEVEASGKTQAFVEQVKKETLKDGERVIGVNEQLLSPDDAEGNRLVRHRETNIGNFCADAFRKVLNVDVAMINGGGIRADLPQGKITYNHLLSVLPFNNKACTATMTGQQLVDALEFSVSFLPFEDGSFMQVSGVKFEVDTTVPTPVNIDEYHLFAGVGEGRRRVSHVQIWDKASQQYLPVDLNRTYTLASFDYQIKNLGCAGIFRYATLQEEHLPQDIEVLATYVREVLGGRIGGAYQSTEGRITIN
jgi:2',3'-cyclic-nucleotide 2'-phosphodiesterase (5'-nucleotidase family)